jgi:hypothetical protein
MVGMVLTVFAVVAIAFLLITIHELGHYICALFLGVSREQIQLHILGSMPPRVEFLGVSGFSEVDQLLPLPDRQLTVAMFIIASGGHIAELIAAIGFTTVGMFIGYEWFATQFVLLSSFITASYLIVAFLSTALFDNSFGDPVELWRRSPPATIFVYVGFFTVTAGLIWMLNVPVETLIRFGIIVPLLFIPMALMAATSQ